MRQAIRRWHTVPFEALFGWFALFAGIVGLLRINSGADPLDAVLGLVLVTIFQIAFAVAGVLMLLGLARAKAWIEAPGLILLSMSSVVRLIAILILYGIDLTVGVSIVFYVLLVYYCGVRLVSLWRGDVILRQRP